MVDWLHNGQARWSEFNESYSDPNVRDLFHALNRYFPANALATGFWRGTFPGPSFDDRFKSFDLDLNWSMIDRLRGEGSGAKKANVIFLSHRQIDWREAERVAKEIESRCPRYRVWLDVWDPSIPAITGSGLPPEQKSILIAMIIEMGLINAKGVIALMTDDSVGSEWIPYEYGRVKSGGVHAPEAVACIRDRKKKLPEYMLLGGRHEYRASHTRIGDLAGYRDLKAWVDAL